MRLLAIDDTKNKSNNSITSDRVKLLVLILKLDSAFHLQTEKKAKKKKSFKIVLVQ